MTPDVTYFARDGLPGEYFACERYGATLSPASCAALYRCEKKSEQGLHPKCKGCPVGMFHAGEAVVNVRKIYRSKLCPRCHCQASRLVKGVCVSCVNRQYELERGRNARGTAPLQVTPLVRAPAVLLMDGAAPMFTVTEYGAGMEEVVLRTMRSYAPAAHVPLFSRNSTSMRRVAFLRGGLFEPPSMRV